YLFTACLEPALRMAQPILESSTCVRHPIGSFPRNQRSSKSLRHAHKFVAFRPRASPWLVTAAQPPASELHGVPLGFPGFRRWSSRTHITPPRPRDPVSRHRRISARLRIAPQFLHREPHLPAPI